MKRIHWIIIAGVVLILTVILVQASKGNKPTEIYTEKSSIRSIVEVVAATGKIQPETEVKISSDVSGEITELLVQEGQQVKKGDLLCRIRPDIYLSAVERMSASVNTTRANLKTAEAQLEQARSSFASSEATFKRNQKLFEQNAISQQDFENIKAQYEGARANVTALEEGVRAGKFTIESSEAGLKEANDNLAKTYIYSPVDATVSKLSVEKGERVMGVSGVTGTEIMRLANLNEMEVSVEVNENDIIKVHKNDTALIEVDAYMDQKFKGIVTEIANSSNALGTSIEQVTNFTVKIRMLRESYEKLISDRNPIPFRPGMSASVDIQTKRVNGVVAVPIQAVTVRSKDSTRVKKPNLDDDENDREVRVKNEDEEKEHESKPEEKKKELVFIYDKGIARQVEVKTGIQDNDYIQILSGLNKDQEVICGPYSAVSKILKDKNKVEKVKKEDLYKDEK
jgi:HlyD family secretion protein